MRIDTIERYAEGHEVVHTIRSFDQVPALLGNDSRSAKLELTWKECIDCRTGKTYDTMFEPLWHINETHIKSSQEPPSPVYRPAEDPNFCWITSAHEASDRSLTWWEGRTAIREFIHMLTPMTRLCEELFYYVAKPHSSGAKDGAAPSLLPSTLTSAFCSILASYLYLSKRISLINRGTPEEKRREKAMIRIRIDACRYAMIKSLEQAFSLLETARFDIIILCSTRREVDCLRIRSVDVHLLPIAFLQNIQAFSVPGRRSEDIVQVYRRYLNVLRRRASRRPQRRVFLDIQEFQEELDALKGLTDTQRSAAEKLISLLFPGSFRVTNEARLERYEAEYELWKKVDRVLKGRLADLGKLAQQSRRLKDDVKQAIEILEEDHGKAIRVFTVVTLFFLPL